MADSPRRYAREYRVSRQPEHAFVEAAVQAAGGRVLFSSGAATAPLFLGVEAPDGSRIGLTAYVFSMNGKRTANRPPDEHRGQVRYGDVNSEAWREQDHPIGLDPAGVDLTVVLMAHHDAGLLVGLDPLAYDPLPIGNSIYSKDAEIDAAKASGWHVWERHTHPSKRRDAYQAGLETVVAFTPDRLFDYLALERQAQTLGLEQPLRFRAAEAARERRLSASRHDLERDFGLSASDLLDIIDRKSRLAMAMRGGVAEHHLGLLLNRDPAIAAAQEGVAEGPPDFHVAMADGRQVTVECKNASPQRYSDGCAKVEVQKTRASKGDPSSRYYSTDAFGVIAACLYGPTKAWTFKFIRSELLAPHKTYAGKIAPLQRVDARWADTLSGALSQTEVLDQPAWFDRSVGLHGEGDGLLFDPEGGEH